MEFLNKVELVGIVGRSLNQDVNGHTCSNFSLITESSSNAPGGISVETTWFNVTAWDSAAAKKVDKGDWVRVIGRFRQRKYYDQMGQEKTTYEVLAKSIEIIGKEG